MNLLVLGTVAFDALETPFGKVDKIVGGAATYASLAASYFTRKIAIVSVVGDDFPQPFIKEMNAHGINTDGLQIKKGEKSFFWSGRYHNDMNSRDTLDTQLNVLADFDPVVPEHLRSPEFLMLGNLMPQIQKQVLDQMTKRPKLVLMDTMNFWMDSQWDALMEVIPMVDVLSINDEEARQMSKQYSLRKAANVILKTGVKFLIIKKGEHGALLFNREGEVFFAPTGAGDTFAGGFIGYLARTGDISFDNMKRAIIHASAMASFTVEKFGTERILNLEKREIDSRVKEFYKLVSFNIG